MHHTPRPPSPCSFYNGQSLLLRPMLSERDACPTGNSKVSQWCNRRITRAYLTSKPFHHCYPIFFSWVLLGIKLERYLHEGARWKKRRGEWSKIPAAERRNRALRRPWEAGRAGFETRHRDQEDGGDTNTNMREANEARGTASALGGRRFFWGGNVAALSGSWEVCRERGSNTRRRG